MRISMVIWFWIGLIVGVSFIATPAKFLAPSIALAEALDVGRATFGVFKWVELTALSTLLLTIKPMRQGRLVISLLIGLITILTTNYLLLLPALDARVELILQGNAILGSKLHLAYVLIELAKIIVLGVLSMMTNRSITNKPSKLTEAI